MRSSTLIAALAAALAAAALAAAQNATTVTTGPGCASLPSIFLPQLATLAPPQAGAICDWLQHGQLRTCNALAMLEYANANTKSDANTTTTKSSAAAKNGRCGADTQLEPRGAPTPFADARPLPATFADPAQVFQSEGETLYWLYRTIRNLENHVACGGTPAFKAPAGWALHKLVDLAQGSQAGAASLPLIALLTNAAAGQLAVIIRGTSTAYEWTLDFEYNQTTAYQDLFGSPMHHGFSLIFNETWGDVRAALDELVVTSKLSTVFVAGHSLGGGMASLIGFATQSYLDTKLGAKAPVASVALFAPPNVGPAAFANKFDTLVNARRLAFEYDVVAQVPCTPQMPACTPTSQNDLVGQFLVSSGIVAIPTHLPGNVTQWPHATVGGSLPFGPSDLPQDSGAWATLANIQICWVGNYLAAAHVCSYACMTSQYSPGGPPADCWLTQQPAGSEGNYCIGFPNDYPGMGGGAPPPGAEPVPAAPPAAGPGLEPAAAPSPAPEPAGQPPVPATASAASPSGALAVTLSATLAAALLLLLLL